jgi:carboxyl-terminal processing protease
LRAQLDTQSWPRLPVPISGISESADVLWKRLDNDIGYIRVRRLKADLPKQLDKAVAKLSDTRGLILDVRGNSGGGIDPGASVRNFNLDDGLEPLRPRYTGPIALLLDEWCISAGEGWASWFIAHHRARTFGSTTSGASSAKTTYTVADGLYRVMVPTRFRSGSLNRPIERQGLEPDVPVRPRAADLAAGKDTILEAARRYLLAPPPAGMPPDTQPGPAGAGYRR